MVRVRRSLATSRERGAPFDRAWKRALRTVRPDGENYRALRETESAWRHAYERAPATAGEAGMARLAEFLERVA